MQTTRNAVDTSKTVFTLDATDAAGHCTGRLDLKRAKFLAYFAKQTSLTVTLEACGGSHHWGRELIRLGHTVRLIALQHVKPFLNVARTIVRMPKRSARLRAADHALRAGEKR